MNRKRRCRSSTPGYLHSFRSMRTSQSDLECSRSNRNENSHHRTVESRLGCLLFLRCRLPPVSVVRRLLYPDRLWASRRAHRILKMIPILAIHRSCTRRAICKKSLNLNVGSFRMMSGPSFHGAPVISGPSLHIIEDKCCRLVVYLSRL